MVTGAVRTLTETDGKGDVVTESSWNRRDFLKRTGWTAAIAGSGPVLLGACSRTASTENLLKAAKENGSITVGIAGEAPYGFRNKQGEVTGEAPEVARAVFKNLGIPKMKAEITDFKGLIPGLRAQHFDVVAAGMYITPERCKSIAFSIPDYTAPTAFLVPKGNPKNITRFSDVANSKDIKLGVMKGAVEYGYAQDLGVADDQIEIYGKQNGLFQAVADGRVYCAALTNISLNHLVQNHSGAELEVTEGFSPTIDGEKQLQAGAFGFRPGNDNLRKAFNSELRKLQQSGKWVQIVKPFGFSEENLPAKDVTTKQLCSG